jgi:hypothetical protein
MKNIKEWLEEVTGELERLGANKTYKYADPHTGEVFEFKRQGIYKKNGRTLIPIR